MKDYLHLQLKNVLTLPDTAVTKILEMLLDQSKSNHDLIIIEENFDEDYRRILLSAHNYFAKLVDLIRSDFENHCLGDTDLGFMVLATDCLVEARLLPAFKTDIWQYYFGFKRKMDKIDGFL